MLDLAAGKAKDEWTLKKQEGKVELWYNNKNKIWGVYLHEQPGQWIMQAIVKTSQDAYKLFADVIDMVKQISKDTNMDQLENFAQSNN